MAIEKQTTQTQTLGSSNADTPAAPAETEASHKVTMLKKQLGCGSCEGLTRNRIFEQRCADLGKLPVSRACGSHRPDVFTLAGGEEKVNLLLTVSEVMNRMGNNDLQILASLMLNEKTTRRFGFKFHQKVYIRVQGETTADYMSNFAVGYVLSADKEHVRVIGESGSMAMTFINDKDSITLYTVARFNPIRKKMRDEKRYVDPAVQNTMPSATTKASGTIKAFDDAVDQGIIVKKKRSERGDLVALVARLGKGHLKVGKNDRAEGPATSVKFKSF